MNKKIISAILSFSLVSAVGFVYADAPAVTADDELDVICGLDETMEYKIDLGEWTSYTGSIRGDLSGNHLVYVRYSGTEDTEASESTMLVFTDEEKFVPGQVGISVKNRNSTLTVEGNVPGAENANVFIALQNNENPAVYLLLKQITTDENGDFVYETELSDEIAGADASGTYILAVNSDKGLISEKLTVNYGSKPSRKSAIGALNDNAENPDAVFDADSEYCNALYSLGFDVDRYNSDEDYKEIVNTVVAEDVKDGGYSEDDESQVNSAADLCELIYSIDTESNPAELQSILLENAEILNLELDGKKHSELCKEGEADVLSWVYEYIISSEIRTIDSLGEMYKEFIVWYKINNATYMTIEDVFGDKAKFLGLDSESCYKEYLELDSKTSVNKEIIKSIKKNVVDNIDNLVDIIESALDSADNKKKTPGKSGGGGGGSGSGGKLPVVGTPAGTENAEVVVPDNTEKTGFPDMDTAEYAKNAVSSLSEKGIVSGYEDGTFRPNLEVTREQFVKMLVEAFDISSEGVTEFGDVPHDAWYRDYISAACSYGLVNGIGNNMFGTGTSVTREDLCVMISRLIEKKGIEIGNKVGSKSFSDSDSISDYARNAVDLLTGAGVVNGVTDSEFCPKDSATRAQCAVIIYRVLNLI